MIKPHTPAAGRKAHSISADHVVLRVPFRFAAAMALILVYGSLLPFNLRPPVHGVMEIPWLDIGPEGRADWLANAILYMPLGFLLMGARARPSLGWGALTFLLGAGLAFVVETTQLIISPRTVSLNDLAAEVVGLAIGIALWTQFGTLFLQAIGAIRHRHAAGLRAFLGLIIALLVLIALFPFDFVVSIGEAIQLYGTTDRLGFLPANCHGILSCMLGLSTKFILGFFVGALGTLLGGRFWLPVFLSALAMLGIEVLQLFMVSGRAEVGNIAVAALGGSVGVWAMRLTRRAPSRVLVWIAVLIKAFAPFYLLMLPIAHGLKIQGFADGAAIYRAAEQLNFLPFYYHYYTTEQNALASTVLILASLLPLGIAMRVIAPRVRGIPVALAGFLLTALLEAAKLLQLAERPDPTNLLIGALGAWLGLVFMRWLVEVLPNLRREPL